MKITRLLPLLVLLVPFPALAATLPLQGRLLTSSGAPVANGPAAVTFRLYDSATATEPLWTETDMVTVADGLFSTTLGDGTPFPPTLAFDQALYVGIRVGADAEMTPRLRLGPSPWLTPAPVSPAARLGSPLSTLSAAKTGRARQISSRDATGGNQDFLTVPAGQSVTLLDVQGAGIIQRFWCTIAPRATVNIHRQAILRMYWDGESTPSVEVPVGDFFGVGFGQQVDFQSLPLNETSGGYNSYWPMPFHRSARWTLTNLSNSTIDAFYYNVDYTALESLPPSEYHFHAQWRRENPTRANENYTILDARGAGHFVGAAMFMQNRQGRGLGFLEGDEMFFIDGETAPSIYGTGTEDYFSSGWYYDRGPYSAPQHGVPIKDTELGRISTYRWHIEDPKPFTQSFRATIEHGHANDHEADYSSVAYWYQTEPHAPFPALPSNPSNLLPWMPPPVYQIPNAIEAEKINASATSGAISVQDMYPFGNNWSRGEQLWWRPSTVNATLTLRIPITTGGIYNVTGYFTRAPDYGKAQMYVLGSQPLGPELNLYGETVSATGAIALGSVSLMAGDNVFTVRITGKDARSTGYMMGIDAFVLTRS